MENNGRFIKKIYLAALLPNVIAVLGGTINVFFDGILVGQRLGDVGFESISRSLPIYLFLCTIGSLFASGAAFLSSIAFGANDRENGQRIFKATLVTASAFALFFCAAGLIFLNPLTSLLTTAETFEYAKTYISITLAGGLFKVILYIPFFYLRLEGKNSRSASAMLVMTVLNIVLDYVFLFVLDLGIAGAAWASVIATFVACVMSFTYLFTDHPNFLPGFAFYKRGDWASIVKYGSPMALNNVLTGLKILFLNPLLTSVGIPGFVAAFAVVNNINEFSICIQNGVPQTATAITGVFFGERDSDSAKKLLRLQIATGMVMSLLFSGALCIFSGKVGLLFGSSADCGFAVIMFAVSLFVAVINSILAYYYNATGRIGMANLINILRGFVAVAVCASIFIPLGERVWVFYPAAELLTLLVALGVGAVEARVKSLSRFYLLDESFERSGHSISFSTTCENESICTASEGISEFCGENGYDAKKTMAISLAIEEMLTIIAQKSLHGVGTMDVRVIKSGDDGILRIRSGGARYNPIEEMSDDPDYMGVRMIAKLAKKTEYLSALGVNTLIIFI